MSAVDIEVMYVKKLNGDGKLKGFADVKIAKEIVVKRFCIAQGPRGLFVSFPREVGKDGRWYETVRPLNESFRETVQDKVLEAYDKEGGNVSA